MKEEKSKKKSIFINGAISTSFISDSIKKHQSKTSIGAHSIFLGQVRADIINNKAVRAIDYTAQEELSNKVVHIIRENTFRKFNLNCLHIYHSLGLVDVGEICLFVFASSSRRKECQKAIEYIVEEIKSKVPIFGKEIFNDTSHQWKVNN